MATKKDLIEAQGFSRRRLLSAFTGGAPGGKELDPAKPLRAVVAGVALTAMVILAGVFYGLVRPGLPQGWEDNRLVLVSDTGARYLTVGGELHPVINTASARLLVPAGDFSVISTDQATVADITVGGTVGIVGAPDDLPAPDALIDDGWTACVDRGAARQRSPFATHPIATAAPGNGTVVTVDDELFVVAGGYRYAVDPDEANAVLRAVGLGASAPIEVDGRWLNLFQPGADLAPLTVEGAGDSIDGTDLRRRIRRASRGQRRRRALHRAGRRRARQAHPARVPTAASRQQRRRGPSTSARPRSATCRPRRTRRAAPTGRPTCSRRSTPTACRAPCPT